VRDLAVLLLHLLVTVARLAGPGGARAVAAESVLVKHQLLILNRSRKRSPNLRPCTPQRRCPYQKVSLPADRHIPRRDLNAVPAADSLRQLARPMSSRT
jgi:hypothetical protein